MKFHQECIALGSRTSITLVSDSNSKSIDSIFRLIWKDVFSFERRFSRFITDSELTAFNNKPGIKQLISADFMKLLKAARRMSYETSGLYNPFVLPALQSTGYLNSRVPGYENDSVEDYSKRSVGAVDQLELGEDWAKIPYDTAIDIGGCGKGYLADLLRSRLTNEISGYCFSLGGDLAIGGYDDNGKTWNVGVENALDFKKSISTIQIKKDCGIATSGTTIHKGIKFGNSWHHLIDPKTRKPAQTDVLLATIEADSTLRADVLASCVVILGYKDSLKFLKNQHIHKAVIQYVDSFGNIQVEKFEGRRKRESIYA